MPAIAILSGVLPSAQAEMNTRFPRNLEPIIVDSNISKGQLRIAAGARNFATGPGIDRGGVEWNGQHYRAMGTKLVQISQGGTITVLGDIGGSDQAAFDYSFDRLAIRSDEKLWYWDGTTLAQVTDEDLGTVVDHIWIDGYHMTTDGRFVAVTELNDPFEVKPLKYGSAESDPDPITGLIKVRGEAYVVGRYTIEVIRNIGGNGFPFQTIRGATIPFGCVNPNAKAHFGQAFAFVGGERNGPLGVHVAGQGTATKISTRTIDDALVRCPLSEACTVETRIYRDEERFIVHLQGRSFAYLLKASQAAGEPVWYELSSGQGERYRIRNAVQCGKRLIVSDVGTARLGILDDTDPLPWGDPVEWRFDVGQIFNEGRGVLLLGVELIALTGRGPFGGGEAFMSYTRDGMTFSMERSKSLGASAFRRKRVQWRPGLRIDNYLGLRFRGFGKGMPGIAACELTAEPLAS